MKKILAALALAVAASAVAVSAQADGVWDIVAPIWMLAW